MDDTTYRECLDSIRRRVQFLPQWRGVNSPAAKSAGLVSVGYVLDVLSRRHVKPLDATSSDPDTELLRWYTDYCQALLEHAELLQVTVRAGKLQLWSQKTRVPLTPGGLEPWLSKDLRGEAKVLPWMPDCREWSPENGAWLDARCIPPGALRADDVDAWAESVGIAESGEVLALLGMAALAAESPAAATRMGGTEKRWTDEFKTEVQAYRDKHGIQAAATKYKVAPATIRKHLPGGWNKPTPLPTKQHRVR